MLSTGTDSDASEKTTGAGAGSGANSGATSCAGAGAGAILDPVSHAPIELRKDNGIDGASTVNAEMQMWAGGATGVTRCPDLVAYLDVLPPHRPNVSERWPI